MSEKKVKAVLVELTQNDCKKVVDGVETVQKGETRKYWYKDEDYAKEVLDDGKYWEECSESSLWLATPDGVTIVDDAGILADWLELPELNLEDAFELEPGQWIEVTFDGWNQSGCRVRMTAFAELPQLSAEQTVKASDLSNKAKARIRINGKLLYAPRNYRRRNQGVVPGPLRFRGERNRCGHPREGRPDRRGVAPRQV